jgi:hypothetical protein
MDVTVFLRHVQIVALRYQKSEIITDTIPTTSHLEGVKTDITLQPSFCYAGTMEVCSEKFITNSMGHSPS